MTVRIIHPFGFLFRGKHVQFGDVLDVTAEELGYLAGRCQPIYVPPKLEEVPTPRPFREMMLGRFRRAAGFY